MDAAEPADDPLAHLRTRGAAQESQLVQGIGDFPRRGSTMVHADHQDGLHRLLRVV